MGRIYKGTGVNKIYVGHCEDGIIYRGVGKSDPIGRYQNGNIYNQFKEHVGYYSEGRIFNRFNEHIGCYKDGIVYNQYFKYTGQKQLGLYESESAEAAALILLFIGEQSANNPENEKHSTYSNYSSNSTSDSDSKTSMFELILNIISLIFGFLIFKVIPFIFVYIHLPQMVAMTWLFLLSIPFLMLNISPVFFPILAICALVYYAFIPYWIMLIRYRVKKQITTKKVLSFYWKWFLKGPFAYKDIIALKKEIENK